MPRLTTRIANMFRSTTVDRLGRENIRIRAAAHNPQADMAYVDAVYNHLDGIRPFGTELSKLKNMKAQLKARLKPTEPGNDRSTTQIPGIVRRHGFFKAFTVAGSAAQGGVPLNRTRKEIEIHRNLEEHFRQIGATGPEIASKIQPESLPGGTDNVGPAYAATMLAECFKDYDLTQTTKAVGTAEPSPIADAHATTAMPGPRTTAGSPRAAQPAFPFSPAVPHKRQKIENEITPASHLGGAGTVDPARAAMMLAECFKDYDFTQANADAVGAGEPSPIADTRSRTATPRAQAAADSPHAAAPASAFTPSVPHKHVPADSDFDAFVASHLGPADFKWTPECSTPKAPAAFTTPIVATARFGSSPAAPVVPAALASASAPFVPPVSPASAASSAPNTNTSGAGPSIDTSTFATLDGELVFDADGSAAVATSAADAAAEVSELAKQFADEARIFLEAAIAAEHAAANQDMVADEIANAAQDLYVANEMAVSFAEVVTTESKKAAEADQGVEAHAARRAALERRLVELQKDIEDARNAESANRERASDARANAADAARRAAERRVDAAEAAVNYRQVHQRYTGALQNLQETLARRNRIQSQLEQHASRVRVVDQSTFAIPNVIAGESSDSLIGGDSSQSDTPASASDASVHDGAPDETFGDTRASSAQNWPYLSSAENLPTRPVAAPAIEDSQTSAIPSGSSQVPASGTRWDGRTHPYTDAGPESDDDESDIGLGD